MKLSEMTNEQAAETMILLAEPIERLCDDEEAVKLIEKIIVETKGKSKTPTYYVVWRIIPRLLAFFMKEHKQDIYEIISAFSGVRAADIGNMNFAETVKLVQNSYDDMLVTFFTSSAKAVSGGGAKSSDN